MALKFFDRVQETSATTGTGTLTLTGALAGYRAFSVIGNANTCDYCIQDGTAWEVGQGTWLTAGNTLSRDIPWASSLGGPVGSATKISCTGNQTVFLTFAAIRATTATRTILTSGSGTYTTPLGCVRLLARLMGGGGAGGSVPDSTTNNCAAGNGGASGAYGEKTITDPATTYSYSVGIAGVPGAAGSNNGGDGGDTSFGSATGGGGKGGPFGTNGNTNPLFAVDSTAALPGTSSGCDFACAGEYGGLWFRFATNNIASGPGGRSPWGGAGLMRSIGANTGKPGVAGTGFGTGGSGAATAGSTGTHGAQIGGPGGPGLIVIDEAY